MKWAVVDIETSGLNPLIHEVIEVGIVTERGVPWHFWLQFDEDKADPVAMEINQFKQRQERGQLGHGLSPQDAASLMMKIFRDRMIVASPAHFDMGFLTAWHYRHGFDTPWGHRDIIDLKSYAMARFGVDIPLKNSVIGQLLDIEDTSDHSAIADAQWTAELWRGLHS